MIIQAFNPVHLSVLASIVVITVAIWAVMRRTSEKAKTIFIVALCAVNMAIYWLYKDALSVDRNYLVVAGLERFNWLNELPIQLCNINMIIIPLGVLTKKRGLLGFSFFLAPLGAMMAMLFPDPAFDGFPLFMPRILGYYSTHVLIVVAGFSLATLGFFRPRYRDIPKITLTFLLLALMSFGINALLRLTGACAEANYFFSWETAGISILDMFWSWIPLPLLYEIPAIAILLVYMLIICTVFLLFKEPVSADDVLPEPEAERELETV